ncbi:MAG: hypothetical protein R3C43_01220 [Chloroflexota bacterium]
MSVKKLTFALLFLLIAVLAACGPTAAEPGAGDPAGTPLPQETPVVETPETGNDSDAIAAATAFLAGELGVAEDNIEVISTEQTEFTDSCLGLGQANESCLQAITPGWLILLEIDGQPYEVRTNETAEQVRLATNMPADDGQSGTAVGAAQEFLAGELGVALGDVQVVSVEAAEFTDSCLGLGGPEEICAQVMTPGWVVMMDVNGQSYEAHTDETGQSVRLAPEM